jgi:DNA-binding NarL/FixJ family response regulator/class 3 adenylate cyclase
MSAEPGTVGFLLCDIEGSTRLVQDTGSDYATILNGVRRNLREAITRHQGTVVDAYGDEVFAAFEVLDDAVAAAIDGQRALIDEAWPGGHDVRVRMGIHVGQPHLTEDGYTGIDVNRTARITSAGHGGQVLLSSAACALTGLAVRDLGSHRLAGLPEPEHIQQLIADGLPRDFPPLRNTIALLGNAMTVVIAEDSILLREGVARLLAESGFEVVAQSDNPTDLLRHVAMHRPAVAIVDIRMPPTHTDEGLVAAREIRGRFPGTGVLVLSQYVEPGYAMGLLEDGADGVGYLLKDRISDLEEFASAVRRVGEGGSALDPAVVSQLVGRRRAHDPLDTLTPREREVMELIAEGRSNGAIADRMFVTLRAVEKHVTSIFTKLDLPADGDDHRRVLAVLAFLRD